MSIGMSEVFRQAGQGDLSRYLFCVDPIYQTHARSITRICHDSARHVEVPHDTPTGVSSMCLLGLSLERSRSIDGSLRAVRCDVGVDTSKMRRPAYRVAHSMCRALSCVVVRCREQYRRMDLSGLDRLDHLLFETLRSKCLSSINREGDHLVLVYYASVDDVARP